MTTCDGLSHSVMLSWCFRQVVTCTHEGSGDHTSDADGVSWSAVMFGFLRSELLLEDHGSPAPGGPGGAVVLVVWVTVRPGPQHRAGM